MGQYQIKLRAHQLVEAIRAGHIAEIEHHGAKSLEKMAQAIENAQCFSAGDADTYLGTSLADFSSPLIKLPFPSTYVEFEDGDAVHAILAGNSQDNGAPCIEILSFSHRPRLGWGGGLWCCRMKEGQVETFPFVDGTCITQEQMASRSKQGIVLCSLFATFLIALNCSNVETISHAPPEKLNKKRISAGKTPLVVFKTLHIKPSASAIERAANGEGRTGPRLHFRRGHIRRLGEDRAIWVQPCMVGSLQSGMVMKDYQMEGNAI